MSATPLPLWARARPALRELATAVAAILLAELVLWALLAVGVVPGLDPDGVAWLLYGPLRTALAVVLYYVLASAVPTEPEVLRRASVSRTVMVVGMAILAASAGSLVISQILELLGVPALEQPKVVEVVKRILAGEAPAQAVALGVSALILAPLFEEIFFRGFVFRRVAAGSTRAVAYGASAVAFAAVHGNLSGFLIYLWLGLVFARAYEATGRIGAAVAVHMANNAFALSLLFLAPDGV